MCYNFVYQDGSRINGEDAPLRKDLEAWMRTHPHYMPDVSDMLGSSSSSSQGALAAHSSNGSNSERRKNKSKHSSSELIEDMSSLSGAENVTVIHRETGAKVRLHFIQTVTQTHTSVAFSQLG